MAESSGVRVYRSGCSHATDLAAARRAGVPIGVVATDLSAAAARAVADYSSEGGRVFIDSGAFGAFRRGATIDFVPVLSVYESLALRSARPENLLLVLPDCVGDQARSLALLRRHEGSARALMGLGAQVMVPLHSGAHSLAECFEQAGAILGARTFAVGVPCNEAAVSAREVEALVREHCPAHVHLLGAGRNPRFEDLSARVLRAAAQQCQITADAVYHRAAIGRGRFITERSNWLAEALRDSFEGDETEIAGELFSDADLTARVARALGAWHPNLDEEAVLRLAREDPEAAEAWLAELDPGYDITMREVWRYVQEQAQAPARRQAREDALWEYFSEAHPPRHALRAAEVAPQDRLRLARLTQRLSDEACKRPGSEAQPLLGQADLSARRVGVVRRRDGAWAAWVFPAHLDRAHGGFPLWEPPSFGDAMVRSWRSALEGPPGLFDGLEGDSQPEAALGAPCAP